MDCFKVLFLFHYPVTCPAMYKWCENLRATQIATLFPPITTSLVCAPSDTNIGWVAGSLSNFWLTLHVELEDEAELSPGVDLALVESLVRLPHRVEHEPPPVRVSLRAGHAHPAVGGEGQPAGGQDDRHATPADPWYLNQRTKKKKTNRDWLDQGFSTYGSGTQFWALGTYSATLA